MYNKTFPLPLPTAKTTATTFPSHFPLSFIRSINPLSTLVPCTNDCIYSGDGREKTFVEGGGFHIVGEKDQNCTFIDLTTQKTKQSELLVGEDGYVVH
jgi:hypothetical protein